MGRAGGSEADVYQSANEAGWQVETSPAADQVALKGPQGPLRRFFLVGVGGTGRGRENRSWSAGEGFPRAERIYRFLLVKPCAIPIFGIFVIYEFRNLRIP